MHTKLTLRLDTDLVQQAKLFAKKTGKSVSRIVADYFTVLERPAKRDRPISWPPLVRSLKGSLRRARTSVAVTRTHRSALRPA